MKDYIWLNITPSTRVARNGHRNEDIRSVEQWTKALTNHCRVAHRGKELESCPGLPRTETKASRRYEIIGT